MGKLISEFISELKVQKIGGSKKITLPCTIPNYENIEIGRKYKFVVKVYEVD